MTKKLQNRKFKFRIEHLYLFLVALGIMLIGAVLTIVILLILIT